jgi:hypothetical protein
MKNEPTYIMQDQVQHKIPSIMNCTVLPAGRRYRHLLIAISLAAALVMLQLLRSAIPRLG